MKPTHLCGLLLLFLATASGFSSPPHRRTARPRTAVLVVQPSLSPVTADNALKAAQICMDARSRELFKKEVKHKYPLIPEAALDGALDWCADGFQEVAPARLQKALRPGGLEKERPRLVRDLSGALMKKVADNKRNSPGMAALALLPEKERAKLTEALLGAVLDTLIANSPEVLKMPEERLYALEQQVRLVKREMGWFRCAWYRVRRGKWRKKALK